MSTSKVSYVDLNVRELFEKHTVEEVIEIHRKVNQEIERKREELRMLVGERYRDLIDAADTIGTMRASSSSVFEKLTTLRHKLNSIPTQLKSPKYSKSQREQRIKLSPEELETAAVLKLSLDTPRQAQLYLDNMKILQAVHLSLLFTRKLSQQSKSYKWTFPVSSGHGEDSADPGVNIENSILAACDEAMNEFQSSPERLAACIVAKQILLKYPCEEIITTFLSSRVQLSEQNLIASDPQFVENVASTIHCLYCIFIEPQMYNAAAKEMRKPKVNVDIFGLVFVPKAISVFNTESILVEEPPRVTRLVEIILKFYIAPLKLSLEKCYASKVYLSEQSSLKEMDTYRKMTTEALKAKCEDLTRIVLGTSKTFWSEVFYPVFQEKCQDVIHKRITSILVFLQDDAFPRFQKLDQQFDLVSFVWKAPSLTDKDKSNVDDDLKLKCLSPHVADLCQELEILFQELMADFQSLGDFSLKEFISSQIVEIFRKFVEVKETEVTDLFLGRFSSALNDLCPTLWKLLGKDDGLKLREFMNSISEKCWTDWGEKILQKFGTDLETKMAKLDIETITTIMPVGEEYVPEEGEESFKPSILVPLQISHVLHTLLFSFCVELARVGPQSIPKNVRETFRISTGQKIASCYAKLVEISQTDEEQQIPPQVALQFIFDMKFIQWFHLKLAEIVEPSVKKLQGIIDPFDLDIVNPRLKTNLKRFLFESHVSH